MMRLLSKRADTVKIGSTHLITGIRLGAGFEFNMADEDMTGRCYSPKETLIKWHFHQGCFLSRECRPGCGNAPLVHPLRGTRPPHAAAGRMYVPHPRKPAPPGIKIIVLPYQFVRDFYVRRICLHCFSAVHHPAPRVHPDMCFHAEIPFVPFPALMHFRVSAFRAVLR